MDDQTRSIIRNVKGPGTAVPRLARTRTNDWLTQGTTQSASMTSSASSNPSARPAASDKESWTKGTAGMSMGEGDARIVLGFWEIIAMARPAFEQPRDEEGHDTGEWMGVTENRYSRLL